MPKLTIQIVGWNSELVLRPGLEVLAKLPQDQAIIRYIDNGSSDNSVSLVQKIVPQADRIRLPKNAGFAEAHNLGFQRCRTPLVMTHDPDLVIDWLGIKQLLDLFTDEKVGALQGKVLRLMSASEKNSQPIIDSAGITLTLAFNGEERGAGEEDQGQFNQQAAIIAPTGAAALYRMSALKAVAHSQTEFFDKDFFAYKEDVDLGWRLNRAGWKVLYVPIRMGWHRRTLGKGSKLGWSWSLQKLRERLASPRTRWSQRNYIWMIFKNVTPKEFIPHSPFIAGRLLLFAALSLFSPQLLAAWSQAIIGAKKILSKRR